MKKRDVSCSAVSCRDPKDKVDAAGIWGDAGRGVSMERCSCSRYTAAVPPWRDSRRAIKPLATTGICWYFQINPSTTNPSQGGDLNQTGLALPSLSARVGRSSSSADGAAERQGVGSEVGVTTLQICSLLPALNIWPCTLDFELWHLPFAINTGWGKSPEVHSPAVFWVVLVGLAFFFPSWRQYWY